MSLWKYRILRIHTPNYKNSHYQQAKQLFDNHMKEFHKRYIKKKIHRNRDSPFSIELIGFDGKTKYKAKTLVPATIFKKVDSMPLGKLMKQHSQLTPKNLSLYANYNKKTSLQGTGYGSATKARNTLALIKKKPLSYQKSLVATMLGRATHHPNQTSGMRKAIVIYKQWLETHKKKQSKK